MVRRSFTRGQPLTQSRWRRSWDHERMGIARATGVDGDIDGRRKTSGWRRAEVSAEKVEASLVHPWKMGLEGKRRSLSTL